MHIYYPQYILGSMIVNDANVDMDLGRCLLLMYASIFNTFDGLKIIYGDIDAGMMIVQNTS